MNKKIILLGLCIFLLVSFVIAALIDNQVSYWKYDVNEASPEDSAGSNDLVNGGASFTGSGKINNAYDFDGTSDSMSTSDSTDFELSAFTFNYWIKPDILETAYFLSTLDQTGNNYGIVHLGYADGAYNILLFTGSGSTSFRADSDPGYLTTSSYQMITVTYDGTTPKLYYDGSEVTYDAQTTGTVGYNTGNHGFHVGFQNVADSLHFDGKMDEIGVWSRALSDAEILELYNSNSGLQYPYGSASTCECSSIQSGTPINCTEECDIDDCDANNVDLVFNGVGKIDLIGDLIVDRIAVDRSCELNNEWGDGNRLIIKNN